MIEFNCPQCHGKFSVADNLAGRRARCKKCGTPLTIPAAPPVATTATAAAAPEPIKPPPRLPPRLRRLKADAEQMRDAFQNFPLIKIRSMTGDPPDTYEIEYFVRGLERIDGRKDPVERSYHTAQIKLTSDYPRMPPQCKMLTPIFHPNIEPATICVTDHWTAGERLVDLVVRIAELITYQAHNIKSPLDGEAAMWTDLNMNNLPIDNRNLRPPELD
jgi:ubiquitin-protein ligase